MFASLIKANQEPATDPENQVQTEQSPIKKEKLSKAEVLEMMQKIDERNQATIEKPFKSMKSSLFSGIGFFLKPALAEVHNQNTEEKIIVPSAIQKLKNHLKKHRVFMDCHPLVRKYALSFPRGKFVTVGSNKPVIEVTDSTVKDIDYMFVIHGKVEIVLEQMISHQKQFQKPVLNLPPKTPKIKEPHHHTKHDQKRKKSHMKHASQDNEQKLPREMPRKGGQNEIVILLQPNDYIDPDKFKLTEPSLKYEDMRELPYLHYLASKKQLTEQSSIIREGLYWDDATSDTSDDQKMENPLFGYRVKSVKSCAQFTEVLVIKNQVFMTFLSQASPYTQISDKSLRFMVEESFGLQEASQRQKSSFFSQLCLREINKNEVLVRINTMPSEVICVIQGKVQIHSQFIDPVQKPGMQITHTDPGSRVTKQQLTEELGMSSGFVEGFIDKMTTIGLECPILMINSPFTYVAATHLVVLSIKMDVLLKEFDSIHPKVLLALQNKLSNVLNHTTQIRKQLEEVRDSIKVDTADKKFQVKQKEIIQNQVQSSFKSSSPAVRHCLEYAYEKHMESTGKPKGQQGLSTIQIRGGITQADMVRLEMIKKQYFFDYDKVEQYLEQQRINQRGEQYFGSPIRTLSLNNPSSKLNDIYSPLSFSSIIDQQPIVEFTKEPLTKGPTKRFFESFQNKYYNQINAQNQQKLERMKEIERERQFQIKVSGNEIQKSPRRFQSVQFCSKSSKQSSPVQLNTSSNFYDTTPSISRNFRTTITDKGNRMNTSFMSEYQPTTDTARSNIKSQNTPARFSHDIRFDTRNIGTPASLFPHKQQTISRLATNNHFISGFESYMNQQSLMEQSVLHNTIVTTTASVRKTQQTHNKSEIAQAYGQ